MSSGYREGLCEGRTCVDVIDGIDLMFQGNQGDDVTRALQLFGSIKELIQVGDALTVNVVESVGFGSIGLSEFA